MKENKSLAAFYQDMEDKSIQRGIETINKINANSKIEITQEKIIDMHTHTNYSDGELSPDELIKLAYQRNISVLSITDHDSVEGLKNIDYNIPELNYIKLIPGIELNAKVNKGTMHILGYNIDINNEALNNTLNQQRTNRANRIISILEQIKRDYGIEFSYSELRELFTANHNLGRPDIAKLCIRNSYATSVQDAFDKYLTPAYNKTRQNNKTLTYQECLSLIQTSGGMPVLAHPKSLELNEKELLVLIKEMTLNGLQGIEVYHSTHSQEEIELYKYIADKYNLLISGGSDFHGIGVKPDIELGTGRKGNLKIKKLSLLDKIN